MIGQSCRMRLTVLCSSQDLALEARDIWLEWNRSIRESNPSELPHPLTPADELLTLCGVYHLADGPEMIDRYVENLSVMEKTAPDFRDLQFIKVRAYALTNMPPAFNLYHRAMAMMKSA